MSGHIRDDEAPPLVLNSGKHVSAFGGELLPYIPLINSSTVPSGSLKQTTPILAPPGPAIFLSGATNSIPLAFRSLYVRSMSSTVKAIRQIPTLLRLG